MIAVSMSRKTRSFDQLAAYMDSEKSDSRFDLHHNYFVRGRENIATTFFENSKFLQSRRNGNYLYHEIISITLEVGVDMKYAKECLREITLKYIQDRSPRNMVYGCLHEDHKDHLHYHLMISANAKDEAKRHWLTKSQFDTLKRDLETHVLENYPNLQQRAIITADQKEKRLSRKASAQKRRTGKLDRQEAVRDTVFRAMSHATSFEAFQAKLKAEGFEYYRRGKHHGVKVAHDDGKLQNYRFQTIGADHAFGEYLRALGSLQLAEEAKTDDSKAASDRKADSEQAENAAQKLPDRPDTESSGRTSSREENAAQEPSGASQEQNEQSKQEEKRAEESGDDISPTEAKSEASATLREFQERRAEREERKREKVLKQQKRKGKPR